MSAPHTCWHLHICSLSSEFFTVNSCNWHYCLTDTCYLYLPPFNWIL